MDGLDLTAAESKATYEEIKDYVLEHSGLQVSNLYIAQVKRKCGINLDLWLQIINRKVSNQARALSIMGMKGAENIDITEVLAAKEYYIR